MDAISPQGSTFLHEFEHTLFWCQHLVIGSVSCLRSSQKVLAARVFLSVSQKFKEGWFSVTIQSQ